VVAWGRRKGGGLEPAEQELVDPRARAIAVDATQLFADIANRAPAATAGASAASSGR
jgi:hypothetical protein